MGFIPVGIPAFGEVGRQASELELAAFRPAQALALEGAARQLRVNLPHLFERRVLLVGGRSSPALHRPQGDTNFLTPLPGPPKTAPDENKVFPLGDLRGLHLAGSGLCSDSIFDRRERLCLASHKHAGPLLSGRHDSRLERERLPTASTLLPGAQGIAAILF